MTINEDYGERKDFGQRVKSMRELRGLTQHDLALLLGYSQATSISNVEKGRRLIHFEEISVLAEALDCSPEELL